MSQFGKRLTYADRKDLKGLSMSEWDRKNIAFLISFYEKAFPGVIKQVAQEARRDIIAERKLRYGKPKSAIDWHRRMAIPEGLMNELRRSYPALIVDKGQFEQFLKWFSQFDLRNV